MVYNNQIPQATDKFSVSQAQLLGNFQAVDNGNGTTGTAGFARNHVTLTDAVNGGLHTRVDYYQATTDPAVTGFVGSLYTKSFAQGGLAATDELFFSNGIVKQLTGAFLALANGYATLGGGILLKWGATSLSGTGVFNFPVLATIPVFTTLFCVFLQPTQTGSPNYFGYASPTNATSFSYDITSRTSNSGSNGAFVYLAIGV
jgi:hypothetical protein